MSRSRLPVFVPIAAKQTASEKMGVVQKHLSVCFIVAVHFPRRAIVRPRFKSPENCIFPLSALMTDKSQSINVVSAPNAFLPMARKPFSLPPIPSSSGARIRHPSSLLRRRASFACVSSFVRLVSLLPTLPSVNAARLLPASRLPSPCIPVSLSSLLLRLRLHPASPSRRSRLSLFPPSPAPALSSVSLPTPPSSPVSLLLQPASASLHSRLPVFPPSPAPAPSSVRLPALPSLCLPSFSCSGSGSSQLIGTVGLRQQIHPR
ncbi:hypothetical protein ACLOJK_023837 [Asimina triloba]